MNDFNPFYARLQNHLTEKARCTYMPSDLILQQHV